MTAVAFTILEREEWMIDVVLLLFLMMMMIDDSACFLGRGQRKIFGEGT
jgi:hypothetical protein